MINPISIQSLQAAKANTAGSVTGTELAGQFSDFLNGALTKLNQAEQDSANLTTSFIQGETTDIHSLMIAQEKVSLGLELTVQARNKMIEAYQEIMRMQM
ncbi:flagellar hook-basal body complex protein FliE [Gorillibacterium timonense]|uniref:flagellar hook-basal body complex protein FliE n=1 Tax=Gorillibacterium timonense TaxID=1689269 RepID=UPI00071D9F26|nr:flagellar hook-basal body complex protein FliE [Gorillibacterium timonense]